MYANFNSLSVKSIVDLDFNYPNQHMARGCGLFSVSSIASDMFSLAFMDCGDSVFSVVL